MSIVVKSSSSNTINGNVWHTVRETSALVLSHVPYRVHVHWSYIYRCIHFSLRNNLNRYRFVFISIEMITLDCVCRCTGMVYYLLFTHLLCVAAIARACTLLVCQWRINLENLMRLTPDKNAENEQEKLAITISGLSKSSSGYDLFHNNK